MTIELGLSSQPFTEKYSVGSKWVTNSWLRSVWEKVDLFGIMVEIGNLDLSPPRIGDEWLMKEFLRMGCKKKELIHLNRVRIHQQVLFLSDVLDAGG